MVGEISPIGNILGKVTDFVKSNPITSTIGGVAVAGASGLAVASAVRKRKKRKTKRRVPSGHKRKSHKHGRKRHTHLIHVKRRKKKHCHPRAKHTGRHNRVSFVTKDGRRVSFTAHTKSRKRRSR